jgi:CheY-like chemotaxis protein
MVSRAWKILVADRNRHVRDLLRRELTAEGYEVAEAWDGHEVWQRLKGPDPPDMLILDPDLPYLEDLVELAHFQEHPPAVPLILYMLREEDPDLPLPAATRLEKGEDPSALKEVVARLLKHRQGRALPED